MGKLCSVVSTRYPQVKKWLPHMASEVEVGSSSQTRFCFFFFFWEINLPRGLDDPAPRVQRWLNSQNLTMHFGSFHKLYSRWSQVTMAGDFCFSKSVDARGFLYGMTWRGRGFLYISGKIQGLWIVKSDLYTYIYPTLHFIYLFNDFQYLIYSPIYSMPFSRSLPLENHNDDTISSTSLEEIKNIESYS